MQGDWKALAGIVATMTAISGCDWLWRAHKRQKSQAWPISHGIVTETMVHKGGDEIILTVRYSYPVEDEPYPVPAEFQKVFPFRHFEEAQSWRRRAGSKANSSSL
jgi:hypothetical protein